MGKHRPKDLWWCGSGKEYKKCHRNREYETPPPIYNLHHELKIASKQRTCRAIWDKGRCSTKIVDSHSISRMTYLEKISENGHVFTLFHDLKLMGQGFSFEESAKFQKIGTRKASVFQSFCSVHDAELFSILDKGSYFDEKFFLQLIYRAACVELQKKVAALRLMPFQRQFDKGYTIEEQEYFQAHHNNNESCHSLGGKIIELAIKDFEEDLVSQSAPRIRFEWLLTEEILPFPRAGFFQPSLSISGRKLQNVNSIPLIDGIVFRRRLESVCLAILPMKKSSLLTIVYPKQSKVGEELSRDLFSYCQNDARKFVLYCLLHMENIYFSPNYVEALGEKEKLSLQSISSRGVGEDLTSEDVRYALGRELSMPSKIISCSAHFRASGFVA